MWAYVACMRIFLKVASLATKVKECSKEQTVTSAKIVILRKQSDTDTWKFFEMSFCEQLRIVSIADVGDDFVYRT